jgi:hypothetical protein
MFATLVTVTLFAAAAINGATAQLTLTTPTLTTCEPAEFTWGATNGPYDLILVSPSDPCGDAMVDLGVIDGTSVSYTPEYPAGTQLEASLVDANDNEAWSGTMTVVQGSNTSCIPASLLASASSTAAASSSSSAAAVSSSIATDVTGTTLVVTGTAASSSASSATTSASGPLGAVGDSGPLGGSKNGALARVSAPFMVISTVAAVLAFFL